MHVRTTHIDVFSFAELSPEAQQRALENASACAAEGWDTDNAEFIYEDAATMAAHLGFDIRQRRVKLMNGGHRMEPEIYYSGFWSQGDGACCAGTWSAPDCDAAALKAAAPKDTELHRIADEFATVAAQYPEATFSVKHRGHYYHSGCTEFDFDSGVNRDSDENCEIDDAFHERHGAAADLKDAARAFMDWIYRQLEREYEYQTGEECAREYCENAGEIFDADGSIA